MIRFEDPAIIRRIVRVLVGVCVFVVLLDAAGWIFVRLSGGDPHATSALPGGYGAYGFIMCVFLVLAAKAMRRFVRRDEDYYAPRASDAEDASDD